MFSTVPAGDKRKKLLIVSGVVILGALVAFGVMAKNGWLPEADALTGKKTGWFGRPLSENASAAWNPLAAPLPTATPQLSKEYVYSGSRLLSVIDANANEREVPPTDLAVWRPSTGYWYVLGGINSTTPTYFHWGGTDDRPAPGDYDGDGKSDFSVFRTTNGTWYVNNSSNQNTTELAYGMASDKLAQADYDGDGKTDMAVFRDHNPNGYWHIVLSSTQASASYQFGLGSDAPAAADYDGDGKADLAIWRDGIKKLYYAASSTGQVQEQYVPAASGSKVVSADYDGDGRADFATHSGGVWTIRHSSNSQIVQYVFGNPTGHQPVQNDYDGDGKVDIAIWDEADGKWHIRQSSRIGQADEVRAVQWGQTGDYPVPAFYRH